MRISKLTMAIIAVLAIPGLRLGKVACNMLAEWPAEQESAESLQSTEKSVVVDETQPSSRHLVLQAPPPVSVHSVAVSPDGLFVAADGVRLYDARTGALLRVIDGAGDRSVAFSPDGRTLAAAGFHLSKYTDKPFSSPSNLVGIYDVQTGKRVQGLAGHTEWETDAIAFSPDGKLFASTGADKQILVWELATGTLRHRLANQPFRMPALAFSPDSATLASGGGDKTIRLWDMATGRLRKSLVGHRDWVCTLAFAPDGKTIASGSCDWAYYHSGGNLAFVARRDPGYVSQCKIWNTVTGELQRTIKQPGRLLSLAFAPDGKSLACGIGNEVRLYDVHSETPGRVVASHDLAVTSVAFTRDGSALISGSRDHTVKRTSLVTGRTEWQAPGYFEQVNSVALSKDAALLATGSGDGRYANGLLKAGAKCLDSGAARMWDARTGRLLRRLGDPVEQIMAVALSPDGRRVAGGGGNRDGSGVVRLWETATGREVWSKEDHTAEVLAIAYAPDGLSMATAAADGLVKLRDPATGAVRQTLAGHAGGATSVAFSADGALLACGEGHGGTRLWEARTGRLLRTCKATGSQAATAASYPSGRFLTSIALTPDGRTLVTNAASPGAYFDEPVRFWNMQTGGLIREFTDRGHGAQPVALSPDGSILAAGGKSVKLWDMRTGKLLRELFGHLKTTQAITFSADGRLLVSGGSYGTTNVWEVATGRHLVTLFTFSENRKGTHAEDWLAYHPGGFYDGSPGVERYLAWRVADDLQTSDSLKAQLHRPDKIEAALRTGLTNVTSAKDGRRLAATDSFLGSRAGQEREVAGLKLCWCPPGKFLMGSPPSEPERRPDEDQVEVTLTKGFWMAKYEATQGEWKRVVGKLPGPLTAELPQGDDYPLGNVNFAEAEEFCKKLTVFARHAGDLPKGWEFRLPTEAQWEYACRAGTTTATAFGDSLSSKQANFKGRPYNGAEPGPSLGRAAKVGSYPANAWGLHDMHGNVYEWCRDWYHQKLPGGKDPDLSSLRGTSRVRRGGAWCDDGWPCRSAFRLRFEPERRYDHIGFRVLAIRP